MRVGEALQALEAVEERSQVEIVNDLQHVSADVIRIRAEGTPNSTLGIEDGVQFISSIRELILAAACGTVAKRRHFATRKPPEAVEYLRRVELGHTERGSYVAAIVSPVAPRLAPQEAGQLFDGDSDPFERKVTTTLAESLDALSRAAEEAAASSSIEAFEQAVVKGVSSNLCAAVVSLAKVNGDQGLDVSFSWARTRRQLDDIPGHVFIEGEAVRLIEEAGRLFRESSEVEDCELYGPVVKPERPEGAPMGTVTVISLVDGKPLKIRMDLEPDIYNLALEAHRVSVPVHCVGELSRAGRQYRLENPRAFELDSDPDE